MRLPHIAPGDCACCGGGDADRDLLGKIERFGWGVVGVTDPRAPFAYTVGLTPLGLPELYVEVPVAGMLGAAQGWLNVAAVYQRDGGAPLAGRVFLGGEAFVVGVMEDVRPLAMARRFYAEGVAALRLVRG